MSVYSHLWRILQIFLATIITAVTQDVDIAMPSVGPAVFCGVGLTLGLLGVATGTFFLIKGNNCN